VLEPSACTKVSKYYEEEDPCRDGQAELAWDALANNKTDKE